MKKVEHRKSPATFFADAQAASTAFVCAQSPVAFLAPLTEESITQVCTERFFELLLLASKGQRVHDTLIGAKSEQRRANTTILILEVSFTSDQFDTQALSRQQIKALHFDDNFNDYRHTLPAQSSDVKTSADPTQQSVNK